MQLQSSPRPSVGTSCRLDRVNLPAARLSDSPVRAVDAADLRDVWEAREHLLPAPFTWENPPKRGTDSAGWHYPGRHDAQLTIPDNASCSLKNEDC